MQYDSCAGRIFESYRQVVQKAQTNEGRRPMFTYAGVNAYDAYMVRILLVLCFYFCSPAFPDLVDALGWPVGLWWR